MQYNYYSKKMQSLIKKLKKYNKEYYTLARKIEQVNKEAAAVGNMFDRDADMTTTQESNFYKLADRISELSTF